MNSNRSANEPAAISRAGLSGSPAAKTATADASLLRFYQRRGFRMTRIDPDIFTPANGYPPGLEADGVPLRDRVWFEISLR